MRVVAGDAGPAANRGWPALVWLSWALAAAAAIQLATNPLYVSLVVAVAALAVQAHARPGPVARAFPVLVAVGVAFALFRLVLTALTTHAGEAALVRLPHATLPRLLGGFTIGGAIELPVVARAAAEGWAIVGIIAAFAAFNSVVSHHELTAAAPRAFHELGLAVTVAVAFVPSTIAAVAAVREADRARTGGMPARRGRLVRQVVPVLENGMERAVHLAESMDSRGFGRGANRGEAAGAWLGLGSLVLLAAALVALVARRPAPAGALAMAGVASLVLGVAVASHATRRARYRRRSLGRRGALVALVPWAAPALLAVAAAAGDDTLRWPGDALALPGAGLLPVLALATLALPAVARP